MWHKVISGGLVCVGHSFAYVAHLWFFRDVWIRIQRAAVASRRATDLATHPWNNLRCGILSSGCGSRPARTMQNITESESRITNKDWVPSRLQQGHEQIKPIMLKFYKQKVNRRLEIWIQAFWREPRFFTHPGSRGQQKGTGSRIHNTTLPFVIMIPRAYAAFLSGGGTRGWKSSGVGVVVGVELGVEEEHPLGVSVSASSPIGEWSAAFAIFFSSK